MTDLGIHSALLTNPIVQRSGTAPVVAESFLDHEQAYKGENFLGKSGEEKEIQLDLAAKLLQSIGMGHGAEICFADVGCGTNWFVPRLYDDGIVSINSVGLLYDKERDMRTHAASEITKIASPYIRENLFVAQSQDELYANTEGKLDVVFLNMVDVCQPNLTSLRDLFYGAMRCLRPEGFVIMTTQNPMAHGKKFKLYQTEFASPDAGYFTNDAALKTRIKNIPHAIGDFHRSLEVTIGTMLVESLKPLVIATTDERRKFKSCDLAALVERLPNKDSRQCAAWVPSVTEQGKLILHCLDRSGSVVKQEVPSRQLISDVIQIKKSAPYLGIVAQRL